MEICPGLFLAYWVQLQDSTAASLAPPLRSYFTTWFIRFCGVEGAMAEGVGSFSLVERDFLGLLGVFFVFLPYSNAFQGWTYVFWFKQIQINPMFYL